jgi:hypothetical protein
MVGHPGPTKHTASPSASDTAGSDKENTSTELTDPLGNSAPSKHIHHTSCHKSCGNFMNIVAFMERQDKHFEHQAEHFKWQEMLQEKMVELSTHAVDLQVQHQGNLLGLLRQALLGPGAAQ